MILRLGNDDYTEYDIYKYKSDSEKVADILLKNNWLYTKEFLEISYNYYTSVHPGYNMDRNGKVNWNNELRYPDPDRKVYGYTVSKFSEEPHACRQMYNMFKHTPHEYFGYVIDYEVPINRRSDKPSFSLRKCRNIDLVSQKNNIIYLLEMKRKPKITSPSDSLLSCVLEIESYFNSFDFGKFLLEYSSESLINKLIKTDVSYRFEKGIIIYEDTKAFRDLNNLIKGKLPNTKAFLKFHQDITIFVMKNTELYAPYIASQVIKIKDLY